MQRINIFVIIIILGLIISCRKKSTEPINADFTNTEVHYTKSGGWIKTSKLDVHGNGTVNAYLMENSIDAEKSRTITISDYDLAEIFNLCSFIPYYNRNYRPAQYRTDQNRYTIIYCCEGQSDTVSVYDRYNIDIPESLNETITLLDMWWGIAMD